MFNKGFSGLITAIVAAVIIIAAGAGIVLWQQTKLPAVPAGEATPPPVPSGPVPSEVEGVEGPTPAPSTPADPTANWKTYRNEQYGFEVKYPVNFEIRDLTLENKPYVKNIILLIGLCDIQFTESCNGTTIHIYDGEFREPSISEGTEVKKFEKGDITFWLGGDNQILSTFKFIK